jgi:hypothetical protein
MGQVIERRLCPISKIRDAIPALSRVMGYLTTTGLTPLTRVVTLHPLIFFDLDVQQSYLR